MLARPKRPWLGLAFALPVFVSLSLSDANAARLASAQDAEYAEYAGQAEQAGQAEHQDGAHDELEEHMESIEDAVKRLRRSLRDDANRADSLELVAALQRASVTAKSEAPPMAASVPDGERDAFLTAYRRTMVDFLRVQLDLEAALLDGDAEAATEAFERVRDMEDSGHERFTEEE